MLSLIFFQNSACRKYLNNTHYFHWLIKAIFKALASINMDIKDFNEFHQRYESFYNHIFEDDPTNLQKKN